MARGDQWLLAVLFAGALAACVTNHEQLEKKPNDGNGGSAAGGVAGASGSFTQFGGNGGDAVSGGGHADDEPPGTSVLTIVNGVVDAPSVALCFAKLDAVANVAPFGAPLTEAPLEYGQSLVVHELAGADLSADTLQPFVIAGELELISGLDCAAAIARARAEESPNEGAEGAQGGAAGDSASGAGGASAVTEGGASGEGGSAGAASPPAVRPRLRVRGLPAIPAGTLSDGYSRLLVANGCLGGATYSGTDAELYCGAGYSETQPTISALLVRLSRQVSFDHVGMQVVNASLSNTSIDVRSVPPLPSQGTGLSLAVNVVEGEVAPRPALLSYVASDYGSTRLYHLEVSIQGSVLLSNDWPGTLARGALTALQDEHTYALVLSGPEGDQKAVPNLWNAPLLTAIAADPE